MSWLWLAAAAIVWVLSAVCIIGTIYDLAVGKASPRQGEFWGGVAFHGVTAILALWLLLKGLN